MYALKAHQLCKSFGGVRVLEDISFSVQKNQIFGIIGPDGAGKSTLFRILCTLLLASSGEAQVLGFDLVKEYRKIRALIGYMPGNFSLYMDLSVRENLEFFARSYNQDIKKNYDLIAPIYEALKPFETRRAKALSGGMKQKLALCCTLIHKPEILFLDEPTTGVDAVSRMEFWDILQILKAQMSIIVSTPYMDEASRCDEIALINKGKFLSISSVDELCKAYKYKLYAFYGIEPILASKVANSSLVHSCHLFGQSCHISLKDEGKVGELLVNLKAEFKNEMIYYEPITPSVEDCFMELLR